MKNMWEISFRFGNTGVLRWDTDGKNSGAEDVGPWISGTDTDGAGETTNGRNSGRGQQHSTMLAPIWMVRGWRAGPWFRSGWGK